MAPALKSHYLAVVGECMIELYQQEGDLFHFGFAGDVYNLAVYFARSGAVPVDMVTAVGVDSYSDRMVDRWCTEGVQARYLRCIADKMPGLYLVETDDHGERDFHYYRNDAAARYMFNGDEGLALLNNLFNYTHVYFSGITLAILHDEGRERFIELLPQLRAKDITICYDSNYRARLWPSKEVALSYFDRIMPFIDMALVSLSDNQCLYGEMDFDRCAQHYLNAGVSRVIVKEGSEGYMIVTPQKRAHFSVESIAPVDTTGAGDSFNGAYLAAIMQGDSDEVACEKAAALARQVVMHKGAIIPK